MKNLRLGFSFYGLIIVVLQLMPNIICVLFPPELNSLEGTSSSTPFIEYGEHILQVTIVILLVFLVNKTQERRIPRGLSTNVSFSAVALYWLCWVLYFSSIQPLLIIYAMVILPPVAFFSAGAAQKIYPISGASVLLLVFHLTVAFENFPIG